MESMPDRAWVGTAAVTAIAIATAPQVGIWVLIVAGVWLAVRRLGAGVLLWVALSGTLAIPLLTVRNAHVHLCTAYLSILLALWGVSLIRQRRVPRMGRLLSLPLIAFAAAAILSCASGILFYDPAVPGVHRFILVEYYATALVVLPIGAAFLVADQLADGASLRWLRRILTGVAVLLLSGDLLPFRLVQAPAWLSLIVAHGLTVLFAVLLCDPPRAFWQRALAAGVVVYGIVRLVALPFFFARTQWLSGWIMMTVPLVCAVFIWSRTLFIVVGLPLAAGGALVTMPWIYDTVTIARAEGDFGRVRIWQDALHMVMLRPALGVGPGNYLDYAMRYAHGNILFGSAHGGYQQVAAEMGIVGLGALLWVLGGAVWLGSRLLRSVEDPLLRSLALAATAALVGQIAASTIGDYIVPAYHNGGHTNVCAALYTWIMIGVLMAIEVMTKERISARRDAAALSETTSVAETP